MTAPKQGASQARQIGNGGAPPTPAAAPTPPPPAAPPRPPLARTRPRPAPRRRGNRPPPTPRVGRRGGLPVRARVKWRASVDCDLSAGDVTAFIGQQEQHKGCDLISRSHAFHWG